MITAAELQQLTKRSTWGICEPKAPTRDLSPTTLAINAAVAKTRKAFTNKVIRQQLGCSANAVHQALLRLERRGKVERVGEVEGARLMTLWRRVP